MADCDNFSRPKLPMLSQSRFPFQVGHSADSSICKPELINPGMIRSGRRRDSSPGLLVEDLSVAALLEDPVKKENIVCCCHQWLKCYKSGVVNGNSRHLLHWQKTRSGKRHENGIMVILVVGRMPILFDHFDCFSCDYLDPTIR